MSFRLTHAIMKMAAKTLGLSASDKHLLQHLATFANDDGTSVRPSIPTLIKETGLSERTILRVLNTLQQEGLIIKIKDNSPQRKPSEYIIVTTRIVTVEKEDYPHSDGRLPPSRQQTTRMVTPYSVNTLSITQSVKPTTDFSNHKVKKKVLCSDTVLTDEKREIAKAFHIPDSQIEYVFGKFKDYWLEGKGAGKEIDELERWKGWCEKERLAAKPAEEDPNMIGGKPLSYYSPDNWPRRAKEKAVYPWEKRDANGYRLD